ncbi:MAG: hypothetical protein DRR19_10510 [Candidatus Parabeggiatoa sp. nov. 1]|nr:MAG: hypothetical protein DRR19_10510 [Gammaproteobacteria bacterium]
MVYTIILIPYTSEKSVAPEQTILQLHDGLSVPSNYRVFLVSNSKWDEGEVEKAKNNRIGTTKIFVVPQEKVELFKNFHDISFKRYDMESKDRKNYEQVKKGVHVRLKDTEIALHPDEIKKATQEINSQPQRKPDTKEDEPESLINSILPTALPVGGLVGLFLVGYVILGLPSLVTLQQTQMTAVLDQAKAALKRNNLEDARHWAEIRVLKFYKGHPPMKITDYKNRRDAEQVLVAIDEIEHAKRHLKNNAQKESALTL